MDVKNKFLQGVNDPTSHHFSNGPSLNRILDYKTRCEHLLSTVRKKEKEIEELEEKLMPVL